ncbi:MAG: nucleotidyltransferase [Phycisphaerae bacterium]|nr:nucleotidyltransferase [Phycisphaerae bacterium]
MGRDWENTFRSWGQPPSQSERDRCENAERAIRKAIAASATLAARSITVFAQGSYANRTNVRQDSDVDICVLCRDVFYYDLPTGVASESYGITPATYEYARFKNEVGTALTDYFGYTAVTRGNKAFDVHANTYRIDADVVPAFEYRRYTSASAYHEGTKFLPDNGGQVINWPTQNYDNGVSKNRLTGERFKAMVRIMKRLRNEMAEATIAAATPIASFLQECLVWNVPDEEFGHDAYKADVRHVIAYLWNNTRGLDACGEWGEINELKYLFKGGQPWTREQVNAFLQAAWDYIGFQ